MEPAKATRFNNAPLSMREMILVKRASEGDIAAIAELLELRRIDKTWDVLALSGDEPIAAMNEMAAGLVTGAALAGVFAKFKMRSTV